MKKSSKRSNSGRKLSNPQETTISEVTQMAQAVMMMAVTTEVIMMTMIKVKRMMIMMMQIMIMAKMQKMNSKSLRKQPMTKLTSKESKIRSSCRK